jgi:TIR domain
MAPELVTKLVVLDLAAEGARVRARRYIASRLGVEQFLVKWYPLSDAPTGFRTVAKGLVFVPVGIEVAEERDVEISCTRRGCRYKDDADMLALILPRGRALSWNDRHPPCEAKEFDGRVAVYWLRPTGTHLLEVVWSLPASEADAESVAADVNASVEDARDAIPNFSVDNYARYDVALSYASEDRASAEEIARKLANAGKRVFFDHDVRSSLWGKALGEELDAIYSKRATFCVLLVSQHYERRRWTLEELRAAVKGAARSGRRDYILPVQLDGSRLEGLPEDIVYVPIDVGTDAICADLLAKLSRV